MTDKRFTYVGDFRLKDNETGDYISISNDISDEDIIVAYNELMCSLLNEQHEQIHFLNMKYAERTSIIGEQSLKIENLEKENKQLKKEVEDLKQAVIKIAFGG